MMLGMSKSHRIDHIDEAHVAVSTLPGAQAQQPHIVTGPPQTVTQVMARMHVGVHIVVSHIPGAAGPVSRVPPVSGADVPVSTPVSCTVTSVRGGE